MSTGSEGLKGSLESAAIYRQVHAFPEIDYLTAHVWPLNWSWVDDRDLAGTEKAGAAKVADYLDQHVAIARSLSDDLARRIAASGTIEAVADASWTTRRSDGTSARRRPS